MSDKKNCAGTYKVSGYIREDGTKVDSYWRTCGAKHEGDNNPSEKYSRSGSAGMTGGAAGVEENNFSGKKDLTFKRLSKTLADEYFIHI